MITLFLLSMVFQSAHTVFHVKSHVLRDAQKETQAKYFSPKVDFSFFKLQILNDSEHSDCDICDFVLGFYVAPTGIFVQFAQFSLELPFLFFIPELPDSFSGSLFGYRGPPTL